MSRIGLVHELQLLNLATFDPVGKDIAAWHFKILKYWYVAVD